jgi:hypothetical protein
VTYATALRAALVDWLGPDKVVLGKRWDARCRGLDWQGDGRLPVALVCHHTAGAATDSTSAGHPGNQRGANKGVVAYVESHFNSPASNFTLDRDGTVYVNTVYPCWHCGEGSFRGVAPYDALGIPDDRGHDFMLGVEIVSKGLRQDFTSAQKWSLGRLANACAEASDWPGFWRRLPNHKTWAPARKIDTRYTLLQLRSWAVAAKARKALGR